MLELYRQSEIEFPVMAAMARFMSDRAEPAAAASATTARACTTGPCSRFPGRERSCEEDFRTESRAKLLEKLLEVSRASYPAQEPGGDRREAGGGVQRHEDVGGGGREGAGRLGAGGAGAWRSRRRT